MEHIPFSFPSIFFHHLLQSGSLTCRWLTVIAERLIRAPLFMYYVVITVLKVKVAATERLPFLVFAFSSSLPPIHECKKKWVMRQIFTDMSWSASYILRSFTMTDSKQKNRSGRGDIWLGLKPGKIAHYLDGRHHWTLIYALCFLDTICHKTFIPIMLKWPSATPKCCFTGNGQETAEPWTCMFRFCESWSLHTNFWGLKLWVSLTAGKVNISS